MKRTFGLMPAWARRAGRTPLRRLCRERRGSAVIEFALVVVPLFALLLAIIETSLVFLAQEGIETATEAAARQILTGTAQTSGMTQAQFQKAACTALPPFLSCSNLMVSVQTATSFSSASTTAPKLVFDKNGNVTNNFSYSTGGAGDIVVVQLIYLWPVSVGLLGSGLGDVSSTQHMLIGTSVAKTELYS